MSCSSIVLIQLPWQPLCHHSSRIPGIHDEASSVRGTAGKLRSQEPRASSSHGAGRGVPWKSCALVLPFDFHLRGYAFLQWNPCNGLMLDGFISRELCDFDTYIYDSCFSLWWQEKFSLSVIFSFGRWVFRLFLKDIGYFRENRGVFFLAANYNRK